MSIDRVALIGWFRCELAMAQNERWLRGGTTPSSELEWVVFEREKLLELVNIKRAQFGKSAVDVAAVLRVENAANGHFDYTQKLAIGAANLAMER